MTFKVKQPPFSSGTHKTRTQKFLGFEFEVAHDFCGSWSCNFCKAQLVVEPTHLKNMRKSNWIISPGIGVKMSRNMLDNHHLVTFLGVAPAKLLTAKTSSWWLKTWMNDLMKSSFGGKMASVFEVKNGVNAPSKSGCPSSFKARFLCLKSKWWNSWRNQRLSSVLEEKNQMSNLQHYQALHFDSTFLCVSHFADFAVCCSEIDVAAIGIILVTPSDYRSICSYCSKGIFGSMDR